MQMQTTTDYAIQILQHLHKHEGMHRAQSVAAAIGITAPLFTKIAARLKSEGCVAQVPGRNGGYALGRPATEISFYDVFLATEGGLCISQRLEDDSDHEREHCKAHEFLQTLQSNMIEDMLGTSIADLV